MTKMVRCYGCDAPTMSEQEIDGRTVMACVNCMKFWTSENAEPKNIPPHLRITVRVGELRCRWCGSAENIPDQTYAICQNCPPRL